VFIRVHSWLKLQSRYIIFAKKLGYSLSNSCGSFSDLRDLFLDQVAVRVTFRP
jgi:hypothetical protein